MASPDGPVLAGTAEDRRLVAGELKHVPPGWYELESGPDTVRLVFIGSPQPKALPGDDGVPEVAECAYCAARITLLGDAWTDGDGATACTDLSAPYVPHKPKENAS